MFAKLFALTLLFGVLGLILSCQRPESAMHEKTEEFHTTLIVAPGARLSVENRDGNVIVQTWRKDSLDVFALKKTMSAKRELKKVNIEIEQNEKTLITSNYADENARVSVNYDIKIPEDLVVERLETVNGDIRLSGAKGDAVTLSSNGKITIEDVDGYVTALTKNGAIDITGTAGVLKAASSNGRIKAEILGIRDSGVDFMLSNGNIRLYIREGLDLDVEMGTTNGKMVLHEIEISATESTPERIKGKIGQGGPRVYVRTTNGNIDLLRLVEEN
jgi:DUF4097 and DUF4098 domain-containing protein YvlB